VEEGSFLWRDTNYNIDIIRRHIDNKSCEKCDMNCVWEHNDKTKLLVDKLVVKYSKQSNNNELFDIKRRCFKQI
jgi:hypothetical protein